MTMYKPCKNLEKKIVVSIIIRSYNEEKYIYDCLNSIFKQKIDICFEVILIDSSSEDQTVSMAEKFPCNIHRISKKDFTFGRALNIGIHLATGKIIVCISAHCVPCNDSWLRELINPILAGSAELSFGGQLAAPYSRSSEWSLFQDITGEQSPTNLIESHKLKFNNANSAFIKTLWENDCFDESICAQEDIKFVQDHLISGAKLVYVPTAKVVHFHNFSNKALYKRFVLDNSMNLVLGSDTVFTKLYSLSKIPFKIIQDFKIAKSRNSSIKAAPGILTFRLVEVLAVLSSLLVYYTKSNIRKVALYEICYRTNVKELDSMFMRFFTKNVNISELREIPAFYKFCISRQWKFSRLSGLFSPKILMKLGIRGYEIEQYIEENPGYNVYLFHPYPTEFRITKNFLDIAELEHPGIGHVMGLVWRELYNSDLPNVDSLLDRNIICHCNYFVADQIFWEKYSIFTERFYDLLNNKFKIYLMQKTDYSLSSNSETRLPFACFVFERFLTMFLKSNPDLKVINYAYSGRMIPKEIFPGEINICNEIEIKLQKSDNVNEDEFRRELLRHYVSSRSHYFKKVRNL